MNGQYKYELHLHTSESSMCGHLSAADSCKMYMDEGFAGMVVTDHYHYLSNQNFGSTQKKITEGYIKGYLKAKETARDNFTVLFGMEFKFCDGPDDYLIYGITPEMLLNADGLDYFNRAELRAFADKNGLLIIEAHPFRQNCKPDETPGFLDGVEVYNGHTHHESHNEKALEFSKRIGGIRTAGSDVHAADMVAKGGIITSRPINNEAELVKLLKSGNYTLLRADKN